MAGAGYLWAIHGAPNISLITASLVYQTNVPLLQRLQKDERPYDLHTQSCINIKFATGVRRLRAGRVCVAPLF